MSFLNNSLRGNIVTGLAIGIGAMLVVPVAIRMLSGALKPVAEGAIKGGTFLYGKGMELATEAWNSASRMMAEAQSEISARSAAASTAAGSAVAVQAEPEALAPARARARTRKPRKAAAKTEGKESPAKKTPKPSS